MPLKFLVIFILISQALVAQPMLSDSAEISILTCRPGDDIYNTFGHTAIRVKDSNQRLDEIYNYGLFNFKEPGFVSKFLRGKLLYHLGKERPNNFMLNYNYEKRSVLEQTLNLTTEQKQVFYKALKQNYLPENRSYLYDFFFDNCSTRPRDIIKKSISDLNFPKKNTHITFRDMLNQYTVSKPWLQFGIDLIIGSKADQVATIEQQMFLPEKLYTHLENSTISQNKKLVEKNQLLANFENQVSLRSKGHLFKPLYLFAILAFIECLLFLFSMKNKPSKLLKVYDNLWFILLTIGGCLIIFLWFFTDHSATKENYNLLWLNPLFMWLLFDNRFQKRVSILLCMLLIVANLTSFFIQPMHLASHLICLILLYKLIRKTKNTETKALRA